MEPLGSPYHVVQTLKIPIPLSLYEHLRYSTETIQSVGGYLGGAVEVTGALGSVGTLVFFPAVSLKGLQGK